MVYHFVILRLDLGIQCECDNTALEIMLLVVSLSLLLPIFLKPSTISLPLDSRSEAGTTMEDVSK